MSLRDLIKIDIFGQRNFDGACWNAQHLPGTNLRGLFGLFDQTETRIPFENDQSAITQARRFENDGCPGDPHGHSVRSKFRASGILWHAQKNRAALELPAAPGFVESENGIRAQSRDRQIFKSKLGS
jgi:hypothetical protein